MTPLAVHADPSRGVDHYLTAFVAPAVWAAGRPETSAYQRAVLGDWYVAGRSAVRLTGLADADVAVLPFTLEAVDEHPHLRAVADALVAEAAAAGRVVLVFCHGDRYIPAPGPNCVMLRTALGRRQAGPLDVALPAWVADPAAAVPLTERPWRPRASVCFTGYAHPLGLVGGRAHRARRWVLFGGRVALTRLGAVDAVGVGAADTVRVRALLALRRTRAVDATVVVRDAMTRLDLDRPDDVLRLQEMLHQVADHDYGLAVRGLGNYSYRLYEVLGSGRPALYVDSGALLPSAGVVRWDDILVPVPARSVETLGRRLAAHHAGLTAERFAAAQRTARRAWVDHLSAAGFLTRVATTVGELTRAAGADGLRAPAVAAALR